MEGSAEPALKISDPQARSIGPAIVHLEQSVGDILAEIERIESIKVVFRQKWLTILFERLEGTDEEFVVRYSDHRLSVSERRRLEEYLRQTHGISMLSTELVYTKGPRLPSAVPFPSGEPPRSFAVEIGTGAVKVEGQPIMAAQAVTRHHIFRILWEQYIEDLLQGLPPDRFRVANLDAILRALATRLRRQVVDELSVRRAINRLQNDAMAILRRTLGCRSNGTT